MRQQEARIDEAEPRLGQVAGDDIADAELHIRETRRDRVGARGLQLHRVEIDPDHATARPNGARQFERDVAAAAAGIEAVHPLAQAGALQQRQRHRPHQARDQPQPLAPLGAAPDDVGFDLHDRPPLSRAIVPS
jgi:hypothetical protein